MKTNFLAARLGLGLAAASLLLASVAGPASAATGPYMVKNINASGDSRPEWLTPVGNTLFFVAKGGANGRELWRSDGTAVGTRRVKDIRVGPASSDPQALAAIDGLLYFNADDGTHGRELWVSDGTPDGTRLVRDIQPGAGSSEPDGYTALNGLVYFRADNGVTGQDLWRTNGTSEGTRLVKDLTRGSDESFITLCCVPFAGKLFFARHDPVSNVALLYRTDGTAAGTKPFRDRMGNQIEGDVGGLTVIGPRLFFRFNDDLWKSDGTSGGTRRIAAVTPRTNITGIGQTAFFMAEGGLWGSDGTAATTRLIKAVDGGALYNLDGTLLFFKDDDGGLRGNDQPWISNGTTSGTQSVGRQVSETYPGVVIGSVLYFGGYSEAESETYTGPFTCSFDHQFLWRSDGTAAGTHNVNPDLDYCVQNLTVVGNSLFFTADVGDAGRELWRYVP
jgi:ELWxxDGT repeat protein